MSFYTNYLLWLSLRLQIMRFKNCIQNNFKDVRYLNKIEIFLLNFEIRFRKEAGHQPTQLSLS